MKPSTTKTIQCEFFGWRLLRRGGVYYADGRSNRPNLGKHSLATRDKQEAQQRLRQLDRQMAVQHGLAEDNSTTHLTADVEISGCWARFLDYCSRAAVTGGVSKSTSKRYAAVRDKHLHYCRQVGVSNWTQVNRRHAEGYGNLLSKRGYADRTMYLELTLLVQVTNWLVAEKNLPEASRFSLNLHKPTGSDTYCFTRAQVDSMLACCRQRDDLQWLYPLLATLAMTGLRIGEAQGLRWTDLDLEAGVLHVADERASSRKKLLRSVRTTKGKRGRCVPLHPALRKILDVTTHHTDGYIFHGPRGGRLKPGTARTIFQRDVIASLEDQFPTPPGEIGFARGRFHSFRHFFVSQCFAHGASEGEVKDWVGHRNSEMVAHYRHLHDDVSQLRIQRVQFVTDLGNELADGLPVIPGSSPTEVAPPSIQPQTNPSRRATLSHKLSH